LHSHAALHHHLLLVHLHILLLLMLIVLLLVFHERFVETIWIEFVLPEISHLVKSIINLIKNCTEGN